MRHPCVRSQLDFARADRRHAACYSPAACYHGCVDYSELDGFNLSILGTERSYGGYPSPLSDRGTLERAKDMLRNGESVATVAERSRYKSRAAFIRAFTTIVGKTPSEWRRENGGQKPPDDRLPPDLE
jgi:hypothetical protein